MNDLNKKMDLGENKKCIIIKILKELNNNKLDLGRGFEKYSRGAYDLITKDECYLINLFFWLHIRENTQYRKGSKNLRKLDKAIQNCLPEDRSYFEQRIEEDLPLFINYWGIRPMSEKIIFPSKFLHRKILKLNYLLKPFLVSSKSPVSQFEKALDISNSKMIQTSYVLFDARLPFETFTSLLREEYLKLQKRVSVPTDVDSELWIDINSKKIKKHIETKLYAITIYYVSKYLNPQRNKLFADIMREIDPSLKLFEYRSTDIKRKTTEASYNIENIRLLMVCLSQTIK